MSDSIEPLRLTNTDEELKDNGDRFDPIGDIQRVVGRWYRSGLLPLYLLIFMLFYNLIFFGVFPGYFVYTATPMAATLMFWFVKPWDEKDSTKKIIFATLFLLLSAGLDLIVSISFELNPPLPRYQYRTVPAMIADVGAIISFVGWYFGFRISESQTTSDLIDEKNEEWDDKKSQAMVDAMIAKSDDIDEKVKSLNEDQE